MDTTTYVALSAQVALQKQLETVANNVSNSGTAGFKADRPFFQSYVDQLAGPGGAVAFVEDAATYIDRSSGPMEVTSNPLDIAVDGNGFLAVSAPDGTTQYTRDGHMRVAPDGTLSDSAGRSVLGADGNPIQLPPGYDDIEIKDNGNLKATVNGHQQDIGQIGVFRASSPISMRKSGDGLLTAPQGEMQPVGPDDGVRIVQGTIEGSTVQPMKEIANMTELSRAYERLQNMLSSESDRERKMIDALGHPS
jgi:flagellar basal-body rod protein FlgF